MAPEQTSPHWNRIVGDDWPQIPPSAWHGLASSAREGAEALNLSDVEQARHAFDETVRRSAGLAEIRRALVALEENPRAFAAALSAAADTFDTFGDVVRRTRNQILDVVDDATDRIEQATRGDNNGDDEEGDEAEAEADRQATEQILGEARGEVVDIVNAALNSLGPQGLPRLDDIAEALGQPGPWRTGGTVPHTPRRRPGPHGGPDHHDHPGRHTPGYDGGPWVPGFERPIVPNPELGRILIDLIDDLLRPGPDQVGPQPLSPTEVRLPVNAGEMPGGPAVTGPAPGPGPVTADPGPGPGTPGYVPQVPRVEDAAPQPDVHGGTGGAAVPEVAAADTPSDEQAAADVPAHTEVSEQLDREVQMHRDNGSADALGVLRGTGAPALESEEHPAAPAAAPPIFPAAVASAAGAAPAVTSATAANTGAQTSATSAGGSAPAAGTVSSAQAGRGAAVPVEAHRGPGATGKALTPGASSAVSAVSPGKQPVPIPDGDASAGKSAGPGELVHDAVGAAMLSASAPSFVVGERVDGDLVLARTLLGGIRAVTDSWVVGVDWAVGVLRHATGVSAFVTSNEGRGWLPARLYLPSEVSLPWLWSVAEGCGWEGVADPARVLVEFAIAWGARSGAKLSALASSQPIDPQLGRLLGTVALAGSVPPSDTMDLRNPAPGTLDRLGITAAPGLLDRAAKVPDSGIAVRCLELAVDAHTRVARAELPAVDTMDAPAIRLRILRALRDGRDFADSWWEEIQDADDLIAATALGHRADTGRIGLGELRSDTAALDPGSELSLLRTLTFQRRCNELVLLLAEERSRQTLRDAVYAHAQILGHPFFASPPAAPPAPRRATVSTASVR
ncbi:hypothetical protein [Nocardia grenadensis]|uniref:hypothetical protein n=1 Tax=Nocardia grenadensis TaxID=931537 RepID=UPI003D76353A